MLKIVAIKKKRLSRDVMIVDVKLVVLYIYIYRHRKEIMIFKRRF